MNMNVYERPRPPTVGVPSGAAMSFRVWALAQVHTGDRKRYKCVAAFRYLQEALDYVSYCHSRETDVWFQTPTGVEFKKAQPRNP